MKKENRRIKGPNIIFRFLKKLGTIRYIFLIYVLFTILMSLLLFWNISHATDSETGAKHQIKYLDALFIATSAFSDTGLSTVVIGDVFNELGQALIAICIVVGGIGIFTIKVYLFQSILGLRTNIFSSQVSQTERGGKTVSETKKMIKVSISFLIVVTIIASVIFTLIFYYNPSEYFNNVKANANEEAWKFNPYVAEKYNPYQNINLSIKYGVFHAISSINNAGFDIISSKSLQPYYKDFGFQILTIIIFLIGGIGFPVIYDIWLKMKSFYKTNKMHRFTLFTKFTIITYIATTLIALIMTIAFEVTAKSPQSFWNQAEYGSTWDKLFAIYFQTKSTRSAGFSTVNYFNFTQPTIVLHGILMFIGFSPVSTAGGIRNTTIAVIFLSVVTMVSGKKHINAFRRQIGKETLIKAINVFIIALLLVIFATIAIYADMPEIAREANGNAFPMTYVGFEVCSAFGNSGLSTGVTNNLTIFGKLMIIFVMITGQFGIPQSIKIWGRTKSAPENYQYIYEDVSIG
ncbi:TrkH family potassium uptake protein [Metamycoplasma neophronis]|uniref:TrkH family potassium uptake protein n=1 Tax=Metamycoplasma neophronis TaxID=872983 RepID=A0ABY2Z0B4_9BACT|nr:potassium transporter TrkG [Metamycoplasma neophronis]TPR54320.1 TrkH family potassium uptake protein [Metamycoplasma neophronis]